MANLQILLRQHVGAPCAPVVKAGDRVEKGTLIATPTGLGANIFSSAYGVVEDVLEDRIIIKPDEEQKDEYVKIPAGMKNFYLKFNGGMPSPYCFQPQDEDLDWVEINAFFPIKERTNAFETIEVIAKDIWSRNLMPCNLLPFAMDSGGNYYALNLKNKKIYYYLTDEWDENASKEYNFETNTCYIAQSFNFFINHFYEEEE